MFVSDPNYMIPDERDNGSRDTATCCSYSLGGLCFPAVIPKPSVSLFSVFWLGLHCELLVGACQREQALVVSGCWQWWSVSDSQGKATTGHSYGR